jgi:large conductance mechanosensitive channel
MDGYKKFLLRGNLIELAVAVVIGAVFGALVKSVVDSFINPLLALIGGRPNLTHLAFTINDTAFPYGVFLTNLMSFIVTSTVVYFLVVLPATKVLGRLQREEVATHKECPHCCSEVPIKATRCRFCTSELSEPANATG